MANILIFLLLWLITLVTGTTHKGPLSEVISDHDRINYDSKAHALLHQFALQSSQNNRWHLNISAFSRLFQIEFELDPDIVTKDAVEMMGNGNVRPFDSSHAVRGRLIDDLDSHVFGSVFQDGVFRGAIWPGSGPHYYVEHASEHFKDVPFDFHSVIYTDDHIVYKPSVASGIRQRRGISIEQQFVPSSNGCGLSDESVVENLSEKAGKPVDAPQLPMDPFNSSTLHRHSRSVRSDIMLSCTLYLQADQKLYEYYKKVGFIKTDEGIRQEIRRLFTDHVQAASAIYRNTLFRLADKNIIYRLNFRVNRVLINTTADCEGEKERSNPFCQEVDVTNFLNLNAYSNHNAYCLAYIFTYRDFAKGTLGLAWVGERSSGGVCSKYILYTEGGRQVKKSMNTGVVTLLNYGQKVPQKVSHLTFAHEMGHNFGAAHDSDTEKGCLPERDDENGNYIMYSSATSGNKPNNNKFSSCSVKAMTLVINNRKIIDPYCFEMGKPQAFCGNQLKEEREECDCGFGDTCKEKCCVARKEIGDNLHMCQLKKDVNVLCSPSAGQCCSQDCHFLPPGTLCQVAGECTERADCLGNNGSCPRPANKPDGTVCQRNTKVCRSGDCSSSVCSLIGWLECFVTSTSQHAGVKAVGVDKRQDAEVAMCYVACRENFTNSPCISTYTVSKDIQLRLKYSQLNILLEKLSSHGNSNPIELPPGAPCDEFRGYCDTFLVCRYVNADGPLARLKNLIFNPQSLARVRDWIVSHWWAVMLLCLALILFMALFVKLCAVNTNSTIAHRIRDANSNVQTARKISAARRQQNLLVEVVECEITPPRGQVCRTRTSMTHVSFARCASTAPTVAINEPPPPYCRNEESTQPSIAHGKGKRRGHRVALELQAAKYRT